MWLRLSRPCGRRRGRRRVWRHVQVEKVGNAIKRLRRCGRESIEIKERERGVADIVAWRWERVLPEELLQDRARVDLQLG